jgi:hypothetical protein
MGREIGCRRLIATARHHPRTDRQQRATGNPDYQRREHRAEDRERRARHDDRHAQRD